MSSLPLSKGGFMEERVYTINLRRGVLTSSRWRKSDDSVAFVRNFLKKHMKSDNVKLDGSISKKIWEHGNQNPVRKIRVKVEKDDEGIVTAKLFNAGSVESLTTLEQTEEKKK